MNVRAGRYLSRSLCRRSGFDTGFPNRSSRAAKALLKAAVRINLDKSDQTVASAILSTCARNAWRSPGIASPRDSRRNAPPTSSSRLPTTTAWCLYQSGYMVDKPHPETGETQPDGNLNDEDLEHVHAVVDPGQSRRQPMPPAQRNNGHTNQVFEVGSRRRAGCRACMRAPTKDWCCSAMS